jgi:hypothetical protein
VVTTRHIAAISAALFTIGCATLKQDEKERLTITPDRCGPIPTGDIVTYSLEGDSAAFVVSQMGDVLLRPRLIIDEDDKVVVHVITTRSAAPYLRVKRISPIRSVGSINIAGDQIAALVADSSIRAPLTSRCDLPVRLADFASGRGQVALSG